MLISLVVYCLLGAIAGVLAGLLGVGGGIVIVPMPIQKLTQCRPKFTHQKNAASASVPHTCPAVGIRGVMRISP